MEYLRSSIAALPLVIIGAWLIAGLFGMRITRARGLTRWSTPSRLFHWVMAFAILGTTALMYFSQIYEAQALDDPAAREHYAELLRIHKSLGLLVLFLVGIRFVWNRYHTRPPLPAALTPVKRGIAVANHYLLYAMMVAIPLFGWFASMAYGGRTHFLRAIRTTGDCRPRQRRSSSLSQLAHLVGLAAVCGNRPAPGGCTLASLPEARRDPDPDAAMVTVSTRTH